MGCVLLDEKIGGGGRRLGERFVGGCGALGERVVGGGRALGEQVGRGGGGLADGVVNGGDALAEQVGGGGRRLADGLVDGRGALGENVGGGAVVLPIVSLAAVALLVMVLLSAPALRLSDTVASAALRLSASVAAMLAAALLPSASVVFAASWASARSALLELVLIDSDSCSMRALSRSAAARLRSSSCWMTASARPIKSCFELADAAVERVGDVQRALAEGRVDFRRSRSPMVSVSLAARASISVVTSPMRLSTALTTSLPPSVSVLAMSMTRPTARRSASANGRRALPGSVPDAGRARW